MTNEKYKKGFEQCNHKNRYQEVDLELADTYMQRIVEDIRRAQRDIIEESPFWALTALDSAINQFLTFLSIKNHGLRPKSRICSENLLLYYENLTSQEYDIIRQIRQLRNDSAYDAEKRPLLTIENVKELMIRFQEITQDVI
ncbi:MAG: hypothetical protein ACI83O_000703 [Patescibacteria group bacterium]|jgi:hypothetical protein